MLLNTRKLFEKKKGEPFISNNVCDIKNYLPDQCVGEDGESIVAHMVVLEAQTEAVPAAHDKASIQVAMDKTFPSRSLIFLLDEVRRIEEALINYPLLFPFDEIMSEFRHLFEMDLLPTFQAGIEKYADHRQGFLQNDSEGSKKRSFV